MRKVQPAKVGVWQWHADAAGVVRMGIGYGGFEGEKSKLLYRQGASDDFRVVSRANADKDETLAVPALFLADAGKALIFDEQDGYRSLYEFDLGTMTRGEKVFGRAGYDIGNDVLVDGTGAGVAGVPYIDTSERIHWIDPTIAAIQTQLDAAVPGRAATIVSYNRDRSRFIVEVGGADRPGSYYTYDRAVGQMHFLAARNDALGNAPRAAVKSVIYKARDGLPIEAVLTLPRGREAKRLPLILLPHGGPFARDHEAWDWWTQFMADRGYAVLQPNYRGSSGYGQAFADKGEGQWGLAMQDDLNDAVNWAVEQGIADRGRVCIAGASYGGYAAMRAAQRDPGIFRCAISYAGVSDLDAMLRYDSRFFGRSGRKYWSDQTPDLTAVSPINAAGQFAIPILLMHGEKDNRVPVEQSKRLAEKLSAAGKSVRYVEQSLADHHFSREEDRIQFLLEIEKFLRTHNPA